MNNMNIKAKLSDIIDAIEFDTEESTSYFNRKTGEIVTITEEEFSVAEDGEPLEGYPEWQHENIKTAQEILNSEDDSFLHLPSKYDFHEYRVMEKFCLSIEDQEISDALYLAIKERGAFRRFKDGVHRFGILDEWYKFRDGALKQIAIDWCCENKIPYVDD